MILVVDVDYKNTTANVAALVFEDFTDDSVLSTYTKVVEKISEYQPGEFYKRELPCILEILKIVKEKIDMIIVDGYVWLNSNNKPGLGGHLFQSLNKKIPVIGVAKGHFTMKIIKCRKSFEDKALTLYILHAPEQNSK